MCRFLRYCEKTYPCEGSHTGATQQENQIIAIVDAGIDLRHPDLFFNMSSLQEYGWDYVNQDADPSPTDAVDLAPNVLPVRYLVALHLNNEQEPEGLT